jgi:hypothetical protein
MASHLLAQLENRPRHLPLDLGHREPDAAGHLGLGHVVQAVDEEDFSLRGMLATASSSVRSSSA